MDVPPPASPPRRVLLGPGPSEPAPSVLTALSLPTLGHLDPRFLETMDEAREMLRAVMRAGPDWLVLPVSGTGTAGMEAVLASLIEPGDPVLVGACGYFGRRVVEIARRAGGEVTAVETAWGAPVPVEALRAAARGKRFALVCAVHGETSTGVLQEIPPLRALADELDALLAIDCVTTLGTVPVELARWGVDAAWSGTQKGLSCPPGLAPVALSPRARRKVAERARPVGGFYLDLALLEAYWSGERRAYHHTAPIQMVYGLHEALRCTLLEGLEARFERHRRHAEAFWAGVEALGLELLVERPHRLPPLTTVRVPHGVDGVAVRSYLLSRDSIEIAGGLGPLQDIWRIGFMGAGSVRRNVELCLAALRSALAAQGFEARGDALEAARRLADA